MKQGALCALGLNCGLGEVICTLCPGYMETSPENHKPLPLLLTRRKHTPEKGPKDGLMNQWQVQVPDRAADRTAAGRTVEAGSELSLEPRPTH